MRSEDKTLFAGVEVTEGVDPTLAGTHAIQTFGLDFDPYTGPTITRTLDRASSGADPQLNTNPMTSFSFNCELAGGGAAGTAPQYNVLLQACGFEETIDAGVDAAYTLLDPSSTDVDSLTMYAARNEDSTSDMQYHKSSGIRGNMSISLGRGTYPSIAFDQFLGSYTTPAATTALVADWDNWQDPLAVTNTNTPTFTLDGVDLCPESYSFNLGNSVVREDRPNCSATQLTGRSGSGTFVFKAPDISVKNWFSELESHSSLNTSVAQLVHGTTAGNIVTIDHPRLQLINISHQDVQGVLFYSVSFIALPTTSGNDEVAITVT